MLSPPKNQGCPQDPGQYALIFLDSSRVVGLTRNRPVTLAAEVIRHRLSLQMDLRAAHLAFFLFFLMSNLTVCEDAGAHVLRPPSNNLQ